MIDPRSATVPNVRGAFWQTARSALHLSRASSVGVSPSAGSGDLLTRYRNSSAAVGNTPPMVKLMVAVRRRPDLTAHQFQQYWLSRHGPLVVRCAPAMRIQRYVQNHATESAAAQLFGVDRTLGTSFDGIAEGWWTSAVEMFEAFSSPAGSAASTALAEDEKNFCSDNHGLVVAYEYVFVDDFESA